MNIPQVLTLIKVAGLNYFLLPILNLILHEANSFLVVHNKVLIYFAHLTLQRLLSSFECLASEGLDLSLVLFWLLLCLMQDITVQVHLIASERSTNLALFLKVLSNYTFILLTHITQCSHEVGLGNIINLCGSSWIWTCSSRVSFLCSSFKKAISSCILPSSHGVPKKHYQHPIFKFAWFLRVLSASSLWSISFCKLSSCPWLGCHAESWYWPWWTGPLADAALASPPCRSSPGWLSLVLELLQFISRILFFCTKKCTLSMCMKQSLSSCSSIFSLVQAFFSKLLLMVHGRIAPGIHKTQETRYRGSNCYQGTAHYPGLQVWWASSCSPGWSSAILQC